MNLEKEKLSDEENIIRYQNGNENIIDFIFFKYKNLVHSIAGKYYLNGAEPDDLLQEGMIGLYNACNSFNSSMNKSFKSFAYLCIERQIQSAVKSANRQKNIVLNNALSLNKQFGLTHQKDDEQGEEETAKSLPSPDPTPEDKIIEEETYLERLKQIRQSLSDYEFKILKHYIKGYKYEYIAELIDRDFKSIDNAITRIKTKLKFLKNLKK
ncbi:MAG: sigma-70 family RNA polymerase sigma factor [Clostridia bacterium]|nr:sigma-70 family RNA polymerase sigma factor [Clostridia bacterium]MDD4685831.1 sigma-70 family RNA polymerase sigma factor [Clostridia bacterium]